MRFAYTQIRANDIYDAVEEGYESSKDEISSVSSYNPLKDRTFGSSLSLQSYGGRLSFKDGAVEGERTSLSSNLPLHRLSAAEVLYDSEAGESFELSHSTFSNFFTLQKPMFQICVLVQYCF